MYGEYINEYVRNGAQFLAIITNDGWWNNSPGHKQLLSYSKIRAIESRRDIARSANTGISAVINKRGDVLKTIGYNESGVINSSINLSNQITFYVKYGDYIYRIALFFFLIIVLFYFTKKK
jgi:apolipoprotein N-acyltransferase